MNTRRTPDLDDLNPDQREALLNFKYGNGTGWKRKLNDLWQTGQMTPLLRQIRNNFGPSWLLKLRD